MGYEERRAAWMLRKEKRQEFLDAIAAGKTMTEAQEAAGITEFAAIGIMELHNMIKDNMGKKI